MSARSSTGLAEPIATTPASRAGSARRTSHVDIRFAPDGGLVLSGAARDLVTSSSEVATVAAAEVTAHVDSSGALTTLWTSPPGGHAEALLGVPVAHGFRGALERALDAPEDRDSPLRLLLDDLPVAILISGYARLYRADESLGGVDVTGVQADVCAGWRSDATMMTALRTTGRIPVPIGPPANDLVPADDPIAWHAMSPLPVGAMRRRRLVDVSDGEPHAVYAMFRDTHVGAGCPETILHEYSLRAELDVVSDTLRGCEARPHVLRWMECPAAAASAARVNDRRVGELREIVARSFKGTTTCTHLNDLLRSLSCLHQLAGMLQ